MWQLALAAIDVDAVAECPDCFVSPPSDEVPDEFALVRLCEKHRPEETQ